MKYILSMWLILLCCPGLGAMTDTVYASLTLGSREFETGKWLANAYARPQKVLIAELTSVTHSKKSLEQTYGQTNIVRTSTQLTNDAKLCVVALKVVQIIGDTVTIRFHDPGISDLDEGRYLNNLMLLFLENQLDYAIRKKMTFRDSLDSVVDKHYLILKQTEDTLLSFAGTSEFVGISQAAVREMLDTIQLLKRRLNQFESDTTTANNLFAYLENLLMDIDSFYSHPDSSEYQDFLLRSINVKVFHLKFWLNSVSVHINVITTLMTNEVSDSTAMRVQVQRLMELLRIQLSQETINQISNNRTTQFTSPPAGKKLQPVLLRYNRNVTRYRTQLLSKTWFNVRNAGWIPRGIIVCKAQNQPCKHTGK